MENFDKLYKWISWEAIDLGSFDTYTEEVKDKKGTSQVDDDILKLIDDWRTVLAEDIAKHNGIDIFNLNTAVQKIIDRIVFLRIAEDKQIENYGELKNTLDKKGDNLSIYQRLCILFEKANKVYNAGLFSTDLWLNELNIADKTLANIINHIYYPECPYEFSVLPIEILGSIYEKFLGKVIQFTRKTKFGHSIEIENKPEVQKAGGVYYTPRYIVKYIVENTIGTKIQNLSPQEVSSLRFVDPACGSGSFLVGAYQFLLDWHMDYYYQENNRAKAEKQNKIYYDELSKRYKLSIEEKKNILINNIFGVDIDAQAVEVTKLSLFLKLLEDEGKRLANKHGQTNLFRESDFKLLPTLNENIKCGNSLIGTDYYAEKDLNLFGMEEQRKINVFDWKDEFPGIFKNGGFDTVIGNPPYIFARDDGFTGDEKNYYYNKFTLAQYQLNTYIMFVEQSYNLMNKEACLGFIIPNNWLTIDTTSIFRNFILKECKQKTLVNSYDKVFQGASVDTSILLFSKTGDEIVRAYTLMDSKFTLLNEIDSTRFIDEKTSIINFESISSEEFFLLCKKIENESVKLNTITDVKAGVMAYEVGKGKPIQTEEMKDNRVYHSKNKIDDSYRKYLDGIDVGRYLQGWSGQYLKYGENLAAQRKPTLFIGERILVRQIPAKPPYSVLGIIVSEPIINDRNSMIVIKLENDYSLEYILGILNSRLITFWFNAVFGKMQRKLFPQFKIKELSEFPIHPIDFNNKISKELFDNISSKVIQIQDTYKSIQQTVIEADIKLLKKKADLIDRQIDTLVYKLYELTDEEIKIIEG